MKTRQVIGQHREVTSQQERGVQRRKQLLAAAREMLAEMDPEEMSFKQVARRAGVPDSSAYHFYANKYDLFSAVATQISEEMAAVRTEPFDGQNMKTWKDLISQMVDRSGRFYQRDPVARKVLLGATMPPEVKRVDRENMVKYIEGSRALFEQYFLMPDIPDFDRKLVNASTAHDALLELDVAADGQVSDGTLEEAKLVMTGYLAHFLPDDLPRK